MAKSSRNARSSGSGSSTSLLTLAERRILDGSVGRSLSEATHKQLQATLVKARALRDKWQDLFKRQTMATTRAPRSGEQANTRSLDKLELFGAAVKRLEARIAEAAEAVNKAVASMERAATGSRATKPAAKAATKKAAKSVPSKPARKPSTKAAASAAKASSAATTATSKKARQAGKRKALATPATGQALGFDPKKQRSAKASATRTQLKLDGLSTRRRGHDITTGKQKQARRDSR
jgi:hypothetical protein